MLWLGGALAKKGVTVSTLASQIDLSYTLLQTLYLDTEGFDWGKNIFNASTDDNYVNYIFNKGFGTLDKNGAFVYDFVSNKAVIEQGTSTQKLDSLGKAITQNAYQDFLDRN